LRTFLRDLVAINIRLKKFISFIFTRKSGKNSEFGDRKGTKSELKKKRENNIPEKKKKTQAYNPKSKGTPTNRNVHKNALYGYLSAVTLSKVILIL
jgi:hypothetical protein